MTLRTSLAFAAAVGTLAPALAAEEPAPYTLHMFESGIGKGAPDIRSDDRTRFETVEECTATIKALYPAFPRFRYGHCLTEKKQIAATCTYTNSIARGPSFDCQTYNIPPEVALLQENSAMALDKAGMVKANPEGVYFLRSNAPDIYSYYYNPQTDKLCAVRYTDQMVRDDKCKAPGELDASRPAAMLAKLGQSIAKDMTTGMDLPTLVRTYQSRIAPLTANRTQVMQLK